MLRLYTHQKKAIEFVGDRDWAALFMETGTGKTIVALELIKQWQVVRDADRVIVVCLNTLTQNWVDEAAKWGVPGAVRCAGSKTKRLDIISGDWALLTINYEALRTPEVLEALIVTGAKGLIFDEVHKLKERTAKQTKAARKLAEAVKRYGGVRLGLTGTPVPKAPLDLWSIFDVLDPGANPKTHPLQYGNYWAFEQGVANVKPHPRLGHRVKLYSYPDEKLHELKRRVAPHAVEATKDECLDLPPRFFSPPVKIAMSEEQEKVYKALRDDYICFLEGAPTPGPATAKLKEMGLTTIAQNPKAVNLYATKEEVEKGVWGVALDRQVSVTFAATLLTRLQQVAAGYIKTDDGELRELPNAKGEWLEDMLPKLSDPMGDHKCVIYCRFVYDVAYLTALCERLKLGYVSLSGANSKDAASVVKRFQTDPNVRVFIGNIAVASTGITLTAGNYCVFYDNSPNGADRAQAVDRVYRIGQKRKVTYYDLCAVLGDGKPTVDERVLVGLLEKQELAVKTVANLKELLN